MEYQNKILIITSIIIFIFLLSFQTINAQTNSKHDSLLSELNKTNVDTSKVRFLIELSLVLQETDTSKSIKYLQKAIQISEKVNFKLGKAKALYFLGVLYYKHENYLLALDNFYKSQNLLPELNENNLYVDCLNLIGATFMNLDNYTKAKEYNQKAFNLANENNDKKRQAKSIYGIGLAYYHTADYSEARFYYQKALKIFIEINDKKGTSMCLNCIGSVNVRQKNYDLSIEYYRKSLKISKEINNQKWISGCYNNIAGVYHKNEKIDSSLYYMKKTLEISKKLNNKANIAIGYANLGILYKAKGNIEKALEFDNKSLDIYKQLNDKAGMATIYNNLGSVYFSMSNYTKAIELFYISLKIAQEIENKYNIELLYQDISLCYEKMENYNNAFEYQKLFKQMHDSIFNLEVTKQISEIEIKYQAEKIEQENILLNTNIKLKEKKIQNRKYVIGALLAGIIISIIFVVLIFYLFRLRTKLHKQALILYKKNNEINKLKLDKKNNENKKLSAEKNIKEKENRILDSQRLQKEKLNSLQQEKINFHNRQLSSSALLIISKNDSLQNIKKKVDLIIQHKPKKIREFRKVIREIDNNLEPSNHWEIFKKHFNQVHQGFFDRLKSTHTNLTQNDIRFCAYLKINLGSNEMSQLLNIQTNSVKKIKIRLKKKLNLLQEINLGKYINQI